jgi:hypothetical protein
MSSRTGRVFAIACVGALMALDCGGGQSSDNGVDEPLQVIGGQFFEGDLPGTRPRPEPDAGNADDAGTSPTTGPLSVAFVSVPVLPVAAGQSGQVISGFVTDDAVSVGVRFPDEGTGFWVVPVGPTDPMFPGDISFKFTANFNAGDRAGKRALRFVAIDGAGHAGTQSDGALCFQPRVPDNGHTCNPAKPLPSAVISLRWDANFDVDLHVVTPDGLDINPKAPIGEPFDGTLPVPMGTPRIDRDSLRNCTPDGYLEEDLVFPDPPAKGNYLIYAEPFAACGQTATRFTLTIYEAQGTCPACQQRAAFTRSGELLASQVTAGTSRGLFVYTYSPH